MHLSAGLLGEKVEPLGESRTTPHRVRARGGCLETRDWEEVGPTSRRACHLRRVGGDARADFLLHQKGGAHVGGVGTLVGCHVLFCLTWGVFGS